MIVGRHERCLYNMSFFMPCGGQWGSRQQGLAGGLEQWMIRLRMMNDDG